MAGFIANWFTRKAPERRAGRALADSVMAAARRPGFFLAGLAQDTLEGRFDMVALHGALVIRQLRADGADGYVRAERMGEVLFDRFDHALREEGVGDHSIARRMRRLGEDFYGLAEAVDAALSGQDDRLDQVLARNGLGGGRPDILADYVRAADRALSGQPVAERLSGRLGWPDPPSPE